MVLKVSIHSLFLVLGTLSWVGCRPTLGPGHYEGNFLHKISGKFQSQPVHLELSYPEKSQAVLLAKDHSENTVVTVRVVHSESAGKEVLNMTYDGPNFDENFGPSYSLSFRMPIGPFFLHRVAAGHSRETSKTVRCYSDRGKIMEAALCFNESQFHLTFRNSKKQTLLSLFGSQFNKDPPYELESPAPITLKTAIDEALEKQFDVKLAVEHVFQARNSALAAWLNLIPHITTNLIWNFSPGYISAVATLQALTPFLLPTYWLEANNSDVNTVVQRDTLRIIRANVASSVEQLCYSYVRDQKISEAYELLKTELDHYAGPDQPSLARIIEPTAQGIRRVLLEDRYALSIALGKHNPDAISGVEIGLELLQPQQAISLKQKETADWAIGRSFEIKQLDGLIQIAKTHRTELFFGWIDPSGDQRSSLGFNLIGQERVARSQITELELKREKLREYLYRDTYIAVLDYNISLQHLLATLKSAGPSSPPIFNPPEADLVEKVRNYLAGVVEYESHLAAFRSARAKIDRIVLSGYFEQLLPQIDPNEEVVSTSCFGSSCL